MFISTAVGGGGARADSGPPRLMTGCRLAMIVLTQGPVSAVTKTDPIISYSGEERQWGIET